MTRAVHRRLSAPCGEPLEVKHVNGIVGDGLFATNDLRAHTAWRVESKLVSTRGGSGYVFEFTGRESAFWIQGQVVFRAMADKFVNVSACLTHARDCGNVHGNIAFFKVDKASIFMKINDAVYNNGMSSSEYRRREVSTNVVFMVELSAEGTAGLVCVTTAPIAAGEQLLTCYGCRFWGMR